MESCTMSRISGKWAIFSISISCVPCDLTGLICLFALLVIVGMAFQKEIVITQCVLDGKGALCCFWGKTCGKFYYTWKGEGLLKNAGFCDELFTRMTANNSSYHCIHLPLLPARDEAYEEEMKSGKKSSQIGAGSLTCFDQQDGAHVRL